MQPDAENARKHPFRPTTTLYTTPRPPDAARTLVHFVYVLEMAKPVPEGTAQALQLHYDTGPERPQKPPRQAVQRRAAREAACSRRLRRQSLRRLVLIAAAAAASKKYSRSTTRRPRPAPACRRRRRAARGPASAIRSLPSARVLIGASASRPPYRRGRARALPPGGGACAGAGGGSPVT